MLNPAIRDIARPDDDAISSIGWNGDLLIPLNLGAASVVSLRMNG